MNKSEAKEMLDSLLACQNSLDKALAVAENLTVEVERAQLTNFVKSVIADVYVESIRKIVIQHPELEPYK